jgi:hypothetical protein
MAENDCLQSRVVFDRLNLESAIYWMAPGRPFRARLPEERRLGRFSTTYKRRLRASNLRKSRANYVRWIALKWGKQQKGQHPSCDTDVFSRPP